MKNDLNLQLARDSKGKRIDNTLIRLPQPKSDSKFPPQLGAVYHAKDKRRLRELLQTLHIGQLIAAEVQKRQLRELLQPFHGGQLIGGEIQRR